MTRTYDLSYSWHGWQDGASDCEPPEPGKEWLTITEDGEEYAIIVLRTDALTTVSAIAEEKTLREARADKIVGALNLL